MAKSLNFMNKVAVVTGASSGLGQAAAILLAQKGASVVLCGRNKANLNSALEQCVEASGGNPNRFTSVVGDVTKRETRIAIVDRAIDRHKRLDILVANAGVVLPHGNIENATEASFDEMFNTNVKAIFFLIQNALPHLEKFRGNIVNISSMGSTLPIAKQTIYPMTKAAIDHMTRCLALDLAPKGIRVNAVNPSFVPTRITRSYDGDQERATQLIMDLEKKKQLLYGECVTSEAVADTITFLASDAARFVTGQCHVVDGGRGFSRST